MTARAFLDTSVAIAAVNGELPRQGALGAGSLVASTILLAEAASLLGRGRLGAKAFAVLVEALHLESPTPEDLVAAGRRHGALRALGNGKVSLIDCMMYETARRLGLPFLTRDRDLEGQPGVVIL